MRLSFECDEPVSALSRVLDQVRRLGIGLRNLSATGGVVSMELEPVESTTGQVLYDRIGQIGGISLLRREPRQAVQAGQPVQAGM